MGLTRSLSGSILDYQKRGEDVPFPVIQDYDQIRSNLYVSVLLSLRRHAGVFLERSQKLPSALAHPQKACQVGFLFCRRNPRNRAKSGWSPK